MSTSAAPQLDSAAVTRVAELLDYTCFAQRVEAARNASFATYEPWPPTPMGDTDPTDPAIATASDTDHDPGGALWRLAHLGVAARERFTQPLWSDLCALELAAEPAAPGRWELTAHRGLIAARDRPRDSVRGHVHVGEDSLRFAEAILAIAPRGIALDVGCGSGISTCALGRTCEQVHAIDVVEECLDATRLSMGLNHMGAKVAASHALLDAYEPPLRFDCAVGNLPGVPVPPGLAYPPDGAGGPDGLQLMRLFLERCHTSLTHTQGIVIMRFQSLGDGDGPLLLSELRELAPRAGWDISVLTESRIPAAVRAALTAHHALPVNPGIDPSQMLARADGHLADLGYGEYYASTLVARPGAGSVAHVDLSGPSLVNRALRLARPNATATELARTVVPAYYGRAHDLPDSFWEMGSLAFIREPVVRLGRILERLATSATVPELVKRVFAEEVALDPIRARFLHVTVELLAVCLREAGVLTDTSD
jgi:hypothetical protein